MRKHGWQLPYHPLQVVAVSVFLALGFAFYVFFVPFVGRKIFQFVVMGIYTPLITCVFFLYIWCTATDPADPGVFKSKKYLKISDKAKPFQHKESRPEGESASPINNVNAATVGEKPMDEDMTVCPVEGNSYDEVERKNMFHILSPCIVFLRWCPCAAGSHEQSSEQQMSEDGMFYCSLCEVEVFKYSKHCRVCDKCVDGFDHHCRWLNNCIGRKNYRRFFTLMVSALVLLILQWSIGILVLICCFLNRKQFSVEIISKLGSSFSLVPFIVVVASCTVLAMIATLPLAQLFFFHVLLIKKGISTYDYIIALREQEQQAFGGGQQSPQMSPAASSLTGLSSASSFNRGAWCTPPRLFLEDQFDVVPPNAGMPVNSSGKRVTSEESIRKRGAAPVKISPWTLARLNAEEVSKVAAQARKKSKILQPVTRHDVPVGLETDSSFGSSSGGMVPRLENNRRRANKRGRLLTELPLEPISKAPVKSTANNGGDLVVETLTSLAPLQLEARSAFRTSRAMSSAGAIASSPESSLGSPDLHPFRVSSSGAEELQGLAPIPAQIAKGIQLSRSTSDGYEASGGEDSDRVPPRALHRSSNWSSALYGSGHIGGVVGVAGRPPLAKSKPSCSNSRKGSLQL